MPTKNKATQDVLKHDRNMRPHVGHCQDLAWHDPLTAGRKTPLGLAGLAWFEKERRYRRMPSKPKLPLPQAVDNLANSTAGAQARFQTDSTRVAVRVELTGVNNMGHMAITGSSGFDCYVGPAGTGRGLRYYGTTRFDHSKPTYEVLLFEHSEAVMRNFTLYFPLYTGVKRLEIGLEPGAKVLPAAAWDLPDPVIVYGTSITQGGCASRTGMVYTNILSRWLNVEICNLGFSGSGRGEPEVAQAIATAPKMRMFVMDNEANVQGLDGMRKTLKPFLQIIRKARPKIPILLVSKIRYGKETQQEQALRGRQACLAYQWQLVQELRKAGDQNLHFLDGTDLLGRDYEECTVDGVHATDLGFYRMAEGMLPTYRRLLFGA
ncbi:MAG: SGNH/GDSL hydrolase family protein [Planctomycetota bacterium]|nr:SGNH/GDSL hydrolase family protein [Planctomycetota bacterium]